MSSLSSTEIPITLNIDESSLSFASISNTSLALMATKIRLLMKIGTTQNF